MWDPVWWSGPLGCICMVQRFRNREDTGSNFLWDLLFGVNIYPYGKGTILNICSVVDWRGNRKFDMRAWVCVCVRGVCICALGMHVHVCLWAFMRACMWIPLIWKGNSMQRQILMLCKHIFWSCEYLNGLGMEDPSIAVCGLEMDSWWENAESPLAKSPEIVKTFLGGRFRGILCRYGTHQIDVLVSHVSHMYQNGFCSELHNPLHCFHWRDFVG